MRRLLVVPGLLLPLPARADQIDAVGGLVEMVVFPVAALLAAVLLVVAFGLRARSRTAAVVAAAIGLLPLAGFSALVAGDGGVLFLLGAGLVASLFGIPGRPPPID